MRRPACVIFAHCGTLSARYRFPPPEDGEHLLIDTGKIRFRFDSARAQISPSDGALAITIRSSNVSSDPYSTSSDTGGTRASERNLQVEVCCNVQMIRRMTPSGEVSLPGDPPKSTERLRTDRRRPIASVQVADHGEHLGDFGQAGAAVLRTSRAMILSANQPLRVSTSFEFCKPIKQPA